MINPAERRIMCACSACLILLSGGPGSKFRQIPMRVEVWSDFRLDDAQWQALGIPIQLAFFFRSTPMDRVVAVYPGAAGAIESLPPEQSWNELVSANQRMLKLEPDTEALLINRLRGASEAYRAPIDECYALCGLISTSWHGLSGGAEVWDAVKSFFRDLRRRAELAESNDG